MASYLLTRSLLTRLASHQYTPRDPPPLLQASSGSTDQDSLFKLGSGEELAKQMLCRVCARSGCTPLRESIAPDCDVMCALRMITDVPMSAEDGMPQYICSGCFTRLLSALELRRTCEASLRRFRSILTPLPCMSVETGYPYSKHNFKLMLHNLNKRRVSAQQQTEKRIIKQAKKRKPKIENRRKSDKKKYKCAPCNLSFSKQEELVAHRLRRACVRHPCHVCGQLVLSLRQHLRTTHGESCAHSCRTCGKQFPIAARLRSHMLVHTDTFAFHCDLCPYKSKHKYYMVLHMRTHTGAKPYKCAVCAATFVNPSNLNKHKLTHREKQFRCDVCDKWFRTRTALREHHQAAHMNVKHICRHCGRDFCYKSDLRKHEIRYHDRAKRAYLGSEPAYRRAERLREATWEVPAVPSPPPPPPPPAAPPTFYIYDLTDACVQHAIAAPSIQSVPVPQTTMLLSTDLSLKKDDPTYPSGQHAEFF